jgi:metal-dependent amidase/aminoacylase/carboxypeptidase family protein
MKSEVRRAVDARQDDIERVGREIFAAPEMGFHEVATARTVTEWLSRLGLTCETGLTLTGVKAVLRGASASAIQDAHHKVDRALQAGALALGARLELTTIPGYLPMEQCPAFVDVFRRNAVELVGANHVGDVRHRSGGTDMGDLSLTRSRP